MARLLRSYVDKHTSWDLFIFSYTHILVIYNVPVVSYWDESPVFFPFSYDKKLVFLIVLFISGRVLSSILIRTIVILLFYFSCFKQTHYESKVWTHLLIKAFFLMVVLNKPKQFYVLYSEHSFDMFNTFHGCVEWCHDEQCSRWSFERSDRFMRSFTVSTDSPRSSLLLSGGFHTGSLVGNRARFAWKMGNVNAVTRTRRRTAVPNPRLAVGGGLIWDGLELCWDSCQCESKLCVCILDDIFVSTTRGYHEW